MLFCDIDLLDADFAIKHHQWVGVRDGRIAYIGSVPPAPDEAATFDGTYDARDVCSCPRSTTPMPMPP